MPEEVFLLENVEQILIGADRKMLETNLNTGMAFMQRMTQFGSGVAQQPAQLSGKFFAMFCLRQPKKRTELI